MRRYSKLLGLRAWSIVQRPVWAIIVAIGTIYTFLQVVAHVQAERLVKIFDALHRWDLLYQWWYVPLAVIVLLVLLKAGYELWKEEEQARIKAEGQLREAERERDSLQEQVKKLESRVSRPLTDAEEVKKSCRELAKELIQFAAKWRENEPETSYKRAMGQAHAAKTEEEKQQIMEEADIIRTRTYDRLRSEYNWHFRGRASALLYAAAQQGWVDPLLQDVAQHAGINLGAVEHLSATLDSIGHRE